MSVQLELERDPRKQLIGPISNTNTAPVADAVEQMYGHRPRPRTIENALRRRKLKFKQVGRQRFVTPEQIAKWMDSLDSD